MTPPPHPLPHPLPHPHPHPLPRPQVAYKNLVYRYTEYAIPDELNTFWRMENLRELHASHNCLFDLPPSLCKIPTLTYVDVSYNNIMYLHESLRVRRG